MFDGHLVAKSPNIYFENFDAIENLVISAGNKYYLKHSGNVDVINIVGFGDTEDDLFLHMFYYIEGNNQVTYAMSVFDLTESVNLDRNFITLFEDYDNRFFNDTRIPKTFDTSSLEQYLSEMNAITLKSGNKRYEKLANKFGRYDWKILFRITNYNGMYPLGKIATLSNRFPNKVFLFVSSTRDAGDFINASHTFFVLCGIDISPDICQEYLTKNL